MLGPAGIAMTDGIAARSKHAGRRRMARVKGGWEEEEKAIRKEEV